jgi:hypothetical protein
LPTSSDSRAALVIERSGTQIIAYGTDPLARPSIKGRLLEHEHELVNRDVLLIGPYTVIYEADLSTMEAAATEEPMDWIAATTKRSAPVRLVEVQALKSDGQPVIGKDLVPVGYFEPEQSRFAPAQLVATTALALIAGSGTKTDLRVETGFRTSATSSRNSVQSSAVLEGVKKELGDLLAVVVGILSVFIILISVICLVLLSNGYSFRS